MKTKKYNGPTEKQKEKAFKENNYRCSQCNKKMLKTKEVITVENYFREATVYFNKYYRDYKPLCRLCNIDTYGFTNNVEFLDTNNSNGGHWTKFPNHLTLALARTNRSKYEDRILHAILYKTYGFNKESDWIALSQLSEITGIAPSHCSTTCKKLAQRRYILKKKNKKRNEVMFNKHYFLWLKKPHPLMVLHDKQELLRELVSTKELLINKYKLSSISNTS